MNDNARRGELAEKKRGGRGGEKKMGKVVGSQERGMPTYQPTAANRGQGKKRKVWGCRGEKEPLARTNTTAKKKKTNEKPTRQVIQTM